MNDTMTLNDAREACFQKHCFHFIPFKKALKYAVFALIFLLICLLILFKSIFEHVIRSWSLKPSESKKMPSVIKNQIDCTNHSIHYFISLLLISCYKTIKMLKLLNIFWLVKIQIYFIFDILIIY